MATSKFIKNNAGTLTEESALTASAGAADSGKIPALNASGVLDATIVNSKSISAGAADSGKVAALNASGILDDSILNASATAVANKIPKLDGSGRLPTAMMPVGIGADVVQITSSEVIAPGDFVNLWNSSGAKVRKADATVAGKEAHGFALAGGASGALIDVYFEGSNTAVTGQTPGSVFLSTTAGVATSTAPTGAGNVVQRIGFATSATNINFQSQPPVVLV